MSSCSTEFLNGNITNIKYGTSFGECIGYCKHDLELKQVKVIYNCSGWVDSVQPVSKTENLSASAWDSIQSNLNVNTFFQLDEIIGCPDCADGGSEWLEIKLANGESHKVVFEYFKEPDVIKSQIEKLRKMLSENSCN